MSQKREVKLERFKTDSIEGQSYICIRCQEGALWVTAGKGFDDIVLRKDQQISLVKAEKVVIEALKDSHIFYSVTYDEAPAEAAAEN